MSCATTRRVGTCWVLAFLVVLVTSGCPSGEVGPPPGESEAGADSSADTSPECPFGRMYSAPLAQCVFVGPSGCADVLEGSAAACTPQWCWDWRTAASEACEPLELGCLPVGRACADGEPGCEAGRWPGIDGDCVDPLASSEAPNGLPAIPPVPPVAPPRWCLSNSADDDTVEPCDVIDEGCAHACADSEGSAAGCPAGTHADPTVGGGCHPAGVDWTCPPGFVVDSQADNPVEGLVPCVPDASTCAEPWPAGTKAIHVDVNAMSGGDGSSNAPFKALTDALLAAGPDAQVFVEPGVYEGPFELNRPVRIRGRCAAKTVLQGVGGQATVSIVTGTFKGGLVRLEELSVAGPGVGVAISGQEASLEVRGCWIRETSHRGLDAQSGATVSLEDTVIADTQADPTAAKSDSGVVGWDGASVTASRVRISRARQGGLTIGPGATAAVTELLVDGTAPDETGSFGWGLTVLNGSVTIRRARVVGSTEVGVAVAGGAGSLRAEGLRVEDTRSHPTYQDWGVGVQVQEAGFARLVGSTVKGSREAGVRVQGQGSAVALLGVSIIETLGAASLSSGAGAVAQSEGWLQVSASRISGSRGAGLLARGQGTKTVIYSVLVDATLLQPAQEPAALGVLVGDGAALDATRLRVTQNELGGLAASGPGTRVQLSELTIDANGGPGLVVQQGAEVAVTTARVHDHRGPGVLVSPSSTLLGDALVIDQSVPLASSELGSSAGLVVIDGRAVLRGSRLSANVGIGAIVHGTEGRLSASGLVVDGTATHPSGSAGPGVVAWGGGQARLYGAYVVGNHSAGLWTSGAVLAAVGVRVADTLPNAEGFFGGGAWSLDGGDLELDHCVLSGNHGSGAAFHGGGGAVIETVVAGTVSALYEESPNQEVQRADGVICVDGGDVEITRSLLTDNARAGALLIDCPTVEMRGTVATWNAWGFASVGSTPPPADDNLARNNTIDDRVTGKPFAASEPPQFFTTE